jgi:hypothetical protein
MSGIKLEGFLARLYTDEDLRQRFLAKPELYAREAGLSEQDVDVVVNIDRAGLQMAADSYAWKRKQHRQPKKSLREVMLGWVRRRT